MSPDAGRRRAPVQPALRLPRVVRGATRLPLPARRVHVPVRLHGSARFAPAVPHASRHVNGFVLPAALALLGLTVADAAFLGLVLRLRREWSEG